MDSTRQGGLENGPYVPGPNGLEAGFLYGPATIFIADEFVTLVYKHRRGCHANSGTNIIVNESIRINVSHNWDWLTDKKRGRLQISWRRRDWCSQ